MSYLNQKIFAGHQAAVYALENSIRSNHFYSAGSDRIIAEWNFENHEEGNLIARATDAIYSLCLIPSKSELLMGQGKGEIHVLNLENNQEIKLLKVSDTSIFAIKYSSKHNRLLVVSGDGYLNVLNASDFALLLKVKLSNAKCRCIAINHAQSVFAVGCGEGKVYFFDLETLQLIKSIQAHQLGFSVNALAYSNDDSMIYSGSRDAHLNRFNTSGFDLIDSIPAHNFAIYSIAFNQDGSDFATASRDKTTKVWNTNEHAIIQRLENEAKGHVNSVNALLWLNESTLLSTGDDRSIIAWENQQN